MVDVHESQIRVVEDRLYLAGVEGPCRSRLGRQCVASPLGLPRMCPPSGRRTLAHAARHGHHQSRLLVKFLTALGPPFWHAKRACRKVAHFAASRLAPKGAHIRTAHGPKSKGSDVLPQRRTPVRRPRRPPVGARRLTLRMLGVSISGDARAVGVPDFGVRVQGHEIRDPINDRDLGDLATGVEERHPLEGVASANVTDVPYGSGIKSR